MIALWNDPKFVGVDVGNSETIIEFVFTIVKKLEPGNTSILRLSDSNEYLEGRQIRGVTDVVDESSVNNFNLTRINGVIKY